MIIIVTTKTWRHAGGVAEDGNDGMRGAEDGNGGMRGANGSDGVINTQHNQHYGIMNT